MAGNLKGKTFRIRNGLRQFWVDVYVRGRKKGGFWAENDMDVGAYALKFRNNSIKKKTRKLLKDGIVALKDETMRIVEVHFVTKDAEVPVTPFPDSIKSKALVKRNNSNNIFCPSPIVRS